MAAKTIPLGPFDLISPIGKGGMAVVWMAKHREAGTRVAIKIIHGPRSVDPEFRASFGKEVRAMAALRHPHIVTILDQGEISPETAVASGGSLKANSPYLVMELLRGGTLRERTPLVDWASMKAMLRALLLALGHAHAEGLTHLDLKPDNVLLAEAHTLAEGSKLTDFGIAQAVADPDLLKLDDDEDGVAIGTPLYMAPEQCLGQWRRFGPWTDLYALGCIAFELATGLPPYPRKTRAKALIAHLEAPRPSLKADIKLPQGFASWLSKLLERDPSRRFQRAADALWALEGLGPPSIYPGPRGLHIPPAPDRNPGEDTPPIPQTFVRETEAPPDPILLGAGLGLFGLREPPMVGRDREREHLWQALRQTEREGHPRAIVIRGPTGVGKSRLARWMAHRAHEWGVATVLSAAHSAVATSGDGLTPMFLRHFPCMGLNQTDGATVIRRSLAAMKLNESSLVEALAAYLLPRDKGAPQENQAVLGGTLEVLARERPVILHLDDVQWGPEARSLAIGLQAERELINAPILTLLTVQDGALKNNPDAQIHLDDLMSLPGVDTLTLAPLPPEDHAQLIRQLLGLDGALAQEIERRTQGHPLFAIQLVGDWVKRGLLEVKDGGFSLKRGAKASLPEDMHRLWKERLAHLLESRPDSSRRALEMAAILGQHVDLAEWTDACAAQGFLPRADLMEIAAQHGFIHRVDDRSAEIPHLSFVHGLLRESLEQSAKEGNRWLHHQRAASIMLTRRYLAAPHAYAERLARHRIAARDRAGALDPLLRAAEARRAHGEYKRGQSLLDYRARIMAQLKIPRSDVRWGLGLVLTCQLLMDMDLGSEALKEAQKGAKLAATHGWTALLPVALECVGRALRWSGEMAAARVVYRRALESARAVEAPKTEADCLRGLAAYAWDLGDFASCAQLYSQALAIYRGLGDGINEATCLIVLGQAALRQRSLKEAEAHLRAAEVAVKASGNQRIRAKLLEARSHLADAQGDPAGAESWGREAVGIYQALGARGAVVTALNSLGDLARRRGDLIAAEGYHRRAMEIDNSLRDKRDIATQVNLALVLLLQERFDEVKGTLAGSLGTMKTSGRQAYMGWASACLAGASAGLQNWSDFDHHMDMAEGWYQDAAGVEEDDALPLEKAGALAARVNQTRRRARAMALAEEIRRRLNSRP